MQYSNKNKKKKNEYSSNLEDPNVSNHSINSRHNMNQDSYRNTTEGNGRQYNNPDLDKSTTESGFGGMIFLDPSDINMRRNQNMSPITEGRQTVGNNYLTSSRSPPTTTGGRQSVINSVRHDLNERQDTAKLIEKKPIPTLSVAMPFRKDDGELFDRGERSPKTMMLAGDREYDNFSTKTLNQRRSPIQDTHRINYGYNVNTMKELDGGNILLDQPIGSSFQPGLHRDDDMRENIHRNMRDPRERDREIQYNNNDMMGRPSNQNPYPRSTLTQKMSPNRNLDQYNDSNEKITMGDDHLNKMDKINDLKRISKLISLNQFQGGNMYEPNRIGKNNYDPSDYASPTNGNRMYKDYDQDIENLLKMKDDDNIREQHIRQNLSRQVTMGYNPAKKQGALISKLTQSIKAKEDTLFPDRQQVLQKMNKLSHILLSKAKSTDHVNNRSYEAQNQNDLNSSQLLGDRAFGRATVRPPTMGMLQDFDPKVNSERKTYAFSRSPQQKFIRVTMAMLSSKGPNCEDRIITRVMRYEKGGVVDLHQNSQKTKKYEVRGTTKSHKSINASPKIRFNIKDRERAGKIVQGWWREILNKYKSLVTKINKIQASWRGYWLRKYLYEILYSTILIQNFIDKLNAPLVRCARRTVMDNLFTAFGEKFRARKLLFAIVKIQRQIREFIDNLTEKRKRMCLLLHKLAERRKVDTLDDLKEHVLNNDIRATKRLEVANNLLQKVKKAMRTRIFHDILHDFFNRPVLVLKSKAAKKALKTNVLKYTQLFIRVWFMKWLKNSLSGNSKDKRHLGATKLLKRALIKPLFDELTKSLKSIPTKATKKRVLKALLKNADRYSDIYLRIYLLRWKGIIREEKVEEFKNNLLGKFLHKTGQKILKNNLRRRFNLWKGLTNSIKELKPIVEGIQHLTKFAKRSAYEKIMPLNSVDGIKSRLCKSLMKKSEKFKLIPLRHYLNLWKKIVIKAKTLELTGLIIKGLGGKLLEKALKNMLNRRFQLWKRIAKELAIQDKINQDDIEKKKFFAITKLMAGTEKLAKRQALKTTIPQIAKYLDNKVTELAVQKLLKSHPKLNRILLKNGFNQYKNKVNQLRNKEVRNKFFESLTSKTGSRVKKALLRKYLMRWWRSLPKDVDIKLLAGSELLLKALKRINLKKPVEAFKEKVDLDNAQQGILKAFGLKDKFIKRHWREYLYKWLKIANKIALKELNNELVGKLFSTLLNKFKFRILSNRFSHWKKVPKININDVFERFKKMVDFVKLVVNKEILPDKRSFLDLAKKNICKAAYLKASHKLANLAINGKLIKLLAYFNHWKKQCKDMEIAALKLKCLRASMNNKKINNNKKDLASAFNKWLRNAKLENLLKHSSKNLELVKAIDQLQVLKNRRINFFLTRLHKLMNLDSRGALLHNISKHLLKPRYGMARCFEHWRRLNINHQNEINEKNLVSKLMKSGCDKVNKRMLRDRFTKAFNLWKNLTRKPDDYYLRVTQGKNLADKFIKKSCNAAFTDLCNHKNYKKLIMKMLPPKMRLTQRAEKSSILRLWNKWRKDVSEGRKWMYNSMILDKLSANMQKSRNKHRLSAAFIKWSGIKPKSLHFPDLVKGIDKIENVLKRPFRLPILQKLKRNADAINKNNGLTTLYNKSKTFQLHKMRNYFLKWWKVHLLTDPKNMSRALRNMKRIIVEDHILGPKEKYFRRWLRNMIKKPKDFKCFTDGADKLKSHVLKKALPAAFSALKKHKSPDALKRAIFQKVLPKSEKLMKHYKKTFLELWKRNVDHLKLKEMQGKLLSTLYNKGKTALHKRYLKNCLNIWARKDKKIDFNSVNNLNNITYGVLARKYFTGGFFPDMKTYATNKFLKSVLMKNSKFHLRLLKPYLKRWRNTAQILKDKQIESDLIGKLIAKTKIYFNNKDVKNLLKIKFDLWKHKIRDFDNKMKEIIPKAIEKIQLAKIREMLPHLITPLKKKALKSKKTQKLTNTSKIQQKYLFIRLRSYYTLWKGQVNKLAMRQLRCAAMQNHLKHFTKRMDKDQLLRRFLFWKNGTGMTPTAIAITNGLTTLNKFIKRKQYELIKNRSKMLNLKIPFGISVKTCLIDKKPEIAKSIALRNCAIRPAFKKWKKNCDKLKTREIQMTIFNKLFYPAARNKSKLLLRKAFNKWNDIVIEEKKNNLNKKFNSKILKGIYEKYLNLNLRMKFLHWKNSTENNLKFLENCAIALDKIKKNSQKKTMHEMNKQFIYNKDGFSKFEMIKKILINGLRNSDKGNLVYCFSLWKKNLAHARELALKHKIFKNLINKHEGKTGDNEKNYLHEKFLHWRIKCCPQDYLARINKIRKGVHAMNSGMRKPFNQEILNKVKALAHENKIKELMYRMIADYDKKADIYLLKYRFRHWRMRVKDTPILRRNFAKLLNDYVNTSPQAHYKLIEQPKDVLVECMKSWVIFKKDKAASIQDYCRGLFNIFNRMKIVQRNKNLHALFSKLSMKDAIKIRLCYARWQKNCNMISTEENAVKIQKYLRGKQNKLAIKNDKITRGAENLTKYIKLKTFNDLLFNGQQNRKRQILLRLMDELPEEVKLQFLRKYKIRWWKVVMNERENEASSLITRNLKCAASKKLKNHLLKKQAKMNEITKILFMKYLDKKKIYFNKWIIDTRLNQCTQAGEIIQKYLGDKIDSLKHTRAKLRIFDLFRKAYIHKVKDVLKKSRKVNGDRGAIMFDTLKTIFIERPFEHIKNASCWIGRIRKLTVVYPRLCASLRLHWLPHYLRKWKERTWDDKVKKIILMQNWFKARMILWRARVANKQLAMLNKYLMKFTKDSEMLKKLAMKLWNRKAKITALHKQAEAVQSIWRGNTSRKNVDRQLNKLKIGKLAKKMVLKGITDVLTKCSDFTEPIRRNLAKLNGRIERRYPTNNLIDLANDAIRNAYMFNLTKKRAFRSELTLLREYFNRMKTNGEILDNNARNVQTKYRQFLAKKRLADMLKMKDKLLKIFGQYDDSEQAKLKTALHLWNNKANFFKLNDGALTIQKYVKVKNARWQNKKVKNFFNDRAPMIIKKRINNAAKVDKLKHILQVQAMRKIYDRLKFNEKMTKLLWIFAKRFSSIDDQLKSLYIRKNLKEWADRAKKITNKMNAAALLIMTLFKGHLSRKFVADLLRKKARVLKLALKLFNDLEAKKAVLFRIWKNITKADKLESSAKVLQNYMADVKKKNDKLKSKRLLKAANEGNNIIDKVWLKAAPVNAIKKIKSEANRKLLTKVGNDIENKKINHLQAALDAIKYFVDKKTKKKLKSVKKIQSAHKDKKFRQTIQLLISKIQKMRFMLKLMANRDLRMLNKSFKLWKKNAMGDVWHKSAETIQDFLDKRVLRWRNAQQISAKEKLHKLLRDHIVKTNLVPYHRDLKNTIKHNKLAELLKQYIFKKFKYNVFNYEKLSTMSKLFKLPKLLSLKLLRKWIIIWRDKADAMKKKAAAISIQNKFKSHKIIKKRKLLSQRVENILLKLSMRNEDIRKYHFTIWKRNNQKLKNIESAETINNFIGKHYNSLQTMRKWWKLTNGLFIKNNIYSGLRLGKRFKQFRFIKTLFKICNYRIKRDGFDALKVKSKLNNIGKLVNGIFNNFDKRKEYLSIRHYFRKWNHQVGAVHEKERRINNLENIFDRRRKIIAAKTINDACLVKKTIDIIQIIRNKDAFKNLKWSADNKKYLQYFGNNLVRADNDLCLKNNNLFATKIYHVYIYKILDIFNKKLLNFQHNIIKPLFAKSFLNRLSEKLTSGSKFSYPSSLKSSKKPLTLKLKFNSKVQNAKNNMTKGKTSDLYKASYVYTFLENLLRNRMKWAFNGIKEYDRATRLVKLLQSIVDKRIYPIVAPKIIAAGDYKVRTPLLLQNLFLLFRRAFIHHTCVAIEPISRIFRLHYLIRVTLMHKGLSETRETRECFRKWRFKTTMKLLANKKMEAMYKNMQQNYLNMAKEVFGVEEADDFEKDRTAGLIGEFEKFGNRIGMFSNEDISANEGIKHKFYNHATRRYDFGHLDPKDNKDNEESNHDNSIVGEAPDYYYDEGVGDGTHGRYKTETLNDDLRKSKEEEANKK